MTKFHGIVSILLIFAAFVIGGYAIFLESVLYGYIYAGLVIASMPALIYSYCAKCPCRDGKCAHVFPGLITKLLPKRESAPYSTIDYVGLVVPLITIIAFAMPFLIEQTTFLFLYLILFIIGITEIYFFICTRCDNEFCMMNRKT